jgi:hypothetical protein
MQSILLSSARKKSKTMKATKAVTCRRKSKRTASAAKEAWHKMVLQSLKEELKLKKKKKINLCIRKGIKLSDQRT